MSTHLVTTTCTADGPLTPDGLPWPLDERWRTEDVLGLARGIREDRAFERLPILADALEEAGCDEEFVLLHCRECANHVADCWVVSFCLEGDPLERPEAVAERMERDFHRAVAWEAGLEAARNPGMHPLQKWTFRFIGLGFGYSLLHVLLKRLFGA